MKARITEKEVFFFPDDECGELPACVNIAMPRNGKPGLRLLIETDEDEVMLALTGKGFSAEFYEMIAVPVECNTGNGEEQTGDMVILPDEKPEYAVKKAPFYVYDCLRPLKTETEACTCLPVHGQKGAAYLCLRPSKDIEPGDYPLALEIQTGEGRQSCQIIVRVYDVEIPERTFGITNWFSIEAICRFHHVEEGSTQFRELLKQYIAQMLRMRQNAFYLQLGEECVKSVDPPIFDFERWRDVIELFFENGMKWLETGPLLSRGVCEDGTPDMYTDVFKCAAAPGLPLESAAGKAFTEAFVRELAAFLKVNGWADRVLFHIHDEPDVHYKDEQTLESRKRQYTLAVGIVKKYLPEAQIIEAVKTTGFCKDIDVAVPVTSSYEEEKEAFDKIKEDGKQLWNYVCCVPQGYWLNRFLDQPLIHCRLLFWGCEKNQLDGYLHWGFNQFPLGMDPFQGTSCPNHTGIGTNFPCGDAFIVYPGKTEVWPSLRLEAQRRGAEDLELLRLLRRRNPEFHEELIGEIYNNNHTYQDDETLFSDVYENLLIQLQKQG